MPPWPTVFSRSRSQYYFYLKSMATYLFLARDRFLRKIKPTPWPRTMKLEHSTRNENSHCALFCFTFPTNINATSELTLKLTLKKIPLPLAKFTISGQTVPTYLGPK